MDIRHKLLIGVLVTSLSLLGAACTAQGEISDEGAEAEIEGQEGGEDNGGLYGD